MKPGTRALGIAVSDGSATATVAGAVVRRDRVTDGFAFTDCTVGGTDGTAAVRGLLSALDRPDVRFLLIAGVAPAWFNLLDVRAIGDAAGIPTVAVSFEDSPGLAETLRAEFDGDALADRLDRYESLPERHRVTVGDRSLWVRAVDCSPERAGEIVRAYTPEGSGRPEPLRVARQAARAGREYRVNAES